MKKMKIEMPKIGTNALTNSSFTTYVISIIIYIIYIIHGIINKEILENFLKIKYYPNQLWSIILPCWITISIFYLYLIYFFKNFYITPVLFGFDGLNSFTDDFSLIIFNLSNFYTNINTNTNTHTNTNTNTSNDHDNTSDISLDDLPVPILRDLPCQLVNQFYFN